MCVAVDVEHFKATFLQGNNNRVHKYMLAELLTQPWTFWLKLTSTTTTGSVVGFSIIVAVFIALFILPMNRWTRLMSMSMFALWTGPAIIFSPLTLAFVIPRVLSGGKDWDLAIGCARDSNGHISCM